MKWLVLIVMMVGCAVERELPACPDCQLQGVHPTGYAMPTSEQFHGKDLERRGWDMALCQGCHGEDFRGRATAPSCMSCHKSEPTACDTCHGNPPTTAAHSTHTGEGLACTECHTVPASWDEHRRPTTRQAVITFGPLAKRGGASPSWDGAKCSNVYCHGGTLADAAASNTQPVWTGANQASCGTCHGKPPASHAQSECASCHPSTKHIDGAIDIGDGKGTCSSCHGDAQSPAPTSGAHRKHLAGGVFSQPIACSECHDVPATVGDAGHIDSAPPAELVFGPLASARGATPAWEHASGTCSNVYCHGSAPQTWTATNTTACGTCHGVPPTSAPHAQAMTLLDCASCHPQTVSAFGNVLVSGGKHMNGVVDAQ